MANEPLALVRHRPPGPGSEDDYQSFCAALGSSARGRAFLAEYARRNRHADTEVLLAALDRLEAQMRGQAAALDVQQIRRDLEALHNAIRAARRDIGDSAAAVRAAKLAALIEQAERHIAAMLAGAPAREPELSIPSPANDEPRSIALVLDPEIPRPTAKSAPANADAQVIRVPVNAARAPAILPELDYFGGGAATPKAPAVPPPAVPAPAAPPPAVVAPAPVESDTAMAAFAALIELPAPVNDYQASETKTEKPARDPLAAIMALSEAERLALFT